MPSAFVPEMYAIDFGTSNSLLAAANRNEVCAPIPLDERAQDPSVFRSILFYSDDAAWSFGAGALSDYVAQGMRGRFIRSIKRFLPVASFSDTRIGSRKVLLEELVGMFLREMRKRANVHFGCDVRRVMLGRPARFSDDDQADALAETRLRSAARVRRLRGHSLLPRAAGRRLRLRQHETRRKARSWSRTSAAAPRIIRSRASIPARADALEVLAIGGVAQAGDAFDGSLMRHGIAEHFGSRVRYQVPFGSNWLEMPSPLMERLCSPADICWLARRDVLEFLRGVRAGSSSDADKLHVDQLLCLIEDSLGFQIFEAIEQQKRELSTHESATFRFEYPGIDIRENMTRARFETASARVSGSILERLDQTLERAGIAASDIDRVCSTGGTAKVPVIKHGLEARFGADKLQALSSFHAVIQGLAERARLLLNQ